MFLQSNLPWLVPANPERRTDRLQGSGTQAVGHVLSAAIMFFSATLLNSNEITCAGVLIGSWLSNSKTHRWCLQTQNLSIPSGFLDLCSVTAFQFVAKWNKLQQHGILTTLCLFPWYPGCWAYGTSYSAPFLYQGTDAHIVQSFEFITLLLATSIRYSV